MGIGKLNPIKNWKAHSDAIAGLSFSSDSTRLMSASRDSHLCVWDFLNAQKIDEYIEPRGDGFEGCKYSPDGRWRTVRIFGGGTLYIFSDDQWNLVQSVYSGFSPISQHQFSHSCQMLATADWQGNLQVWNTENWTEVSRVQLQTSGLVQYISFTPDDQLMSVQDLTFKLLDAATLAVRDQLAIDGPLPSYTVSTLTSDGSGLFGIAGHYDIDAKTKLYRWSAQDWQRQPETIQDLVSVTQFATSPDRVACLQPSSVQIFDNQASLISSISQTGAITALTIDPSGKYLATAGGDFRISIYKMP